MGTAGEAGCCFCCTETLLWSWPQQLRRRKTPRPHRHPCCWSPHPSPSCCCPWKSFWQRETLFWALASFRWKRECFLACDPVWLWVCRQASASECWAWLGAGRSPACLGGGTWGVCPSLASPVVSPCLLKSWWMAWGPPSSCCCHSCCCEWRHWGHHAQGLWLRSEQCRYESCPPLHSHHCCPHHCPCRHPPPPQKCHLCSPVIKEQM